MTRRTSFLALALLPLAWAATVGLLPAPAALLHFELSRSAPAADSVVAPPEEIRLWFTQGAQEDATSIRLLDGSGNLVELGALESSDDRTEHAAAIPNLLADGTYTVAWRSMAADGHVVRGEFEFSVRAQE